MTATVIIVTLSRSDCVRRCLECLDSQDPKPEQIIVVDASHDDDTGRVLEDFPNVRYLRNADGYGRMTASRNIGLQYATGDVIIFVDDDAYVHDGWTAALLSSYDNPEVGAVGGRALNKQPDESKKGVNLIGQLTSWGRLEGWFAADPGKVIEVDHVMGCNMSFRREVLAELGGFRDDYPGISGVREDSDMCLRVKRLGYRILFNPAAIVDHLGAPQANGRRFDTRYAYYAARNHMMMILRNYGLGAKITYRCFGWAVGYSVVEFLKKLAAAGGRFAAMLGGTFVGIVFGLALLAKMGRNPVRRDPEAEKIRASLSGTLSLRAAGKAPKDTVASAQQEIRLA